MFFRERRPYPVPIALPPRHPRPIYEEDGRRRGEEARPQEQCRAFSEKSDKTRTGQDRRRKVEARWCRNPMTNTQPRDRAFGSQRRTLGEHGTGFAAAGEVVIRYEYYSRWCA